MLIRRILINKTFYVLLIILSLLIVLVNINSEHPNVDLNSIFLVKSINVKNDKVNLILRNKHNQILK